MNYTPTQIAEILDASLRGNQAHFPIKEVSVDTRTILNPQHTIFFALRGKMKNGHQFIDKAYEKGVRNFVVHNFKDEKKYPNANFYEVEHPLRSLQQFAKSHQNRHDTLTKIAITGSNGKTVVKEWLYQMLYDVFTVVKSPKSYNSQIGMALSILGVSEEHNLGIFEAGISEKGEMINHLEMLDPDIGLITNIGAAHDEGFQSRAEKLAEKMILFSDVRTLVYCKDQKDVDEYIQRELSSTKTMHWGYAEESDIRVLGTTIKGANRFVKFSYQGEDREFILRFTDIASFENCMHCVALMCQLEMDTDEIIQRVQRISGLHMRLEMTTGIHQSILVNDAYSADLDSLQIALEFVNQQSGSRRKLCILSAFDQSGQEERVVFNKIVDQLIHHGIDELIYISEHNFPSESNQISVQFIRSKEAFFEQLSSFNIANKIILVKGARRFGLEAISERLAEKSHSATLQINLNGLEHNLRVYNQFLNDDTGIVAVIKASAYGSGAAEVGHLLQRNKVEYLAVAFVDEGIELRKVGIDMKIMVLSPDLSSLADIMRYNLEPEVFDFNQLERIVHFTNSNKATLNIHLKFDTGMHRLGFLKDQIDELIEILKTAQFIHVKSIFSHLASSEDAADDAYSEKQFETFDSMYAKLASALQIRPQRHILNSGGISRFPDRQYDLVRLGIGMYGIDNNTAIKSSLRKVHGLHASVIQVKKLLKGESIGYNRKTILKRDSTIGIVNIGYADGLMRNLGNGRYSFAINNSKVPILGSVCMDLTMIDLTDLASVEVGQDVVVFDEQLPIEDLAAAAGTIPYEILSRISSRVKRKFVRE